jgi:hypothetical protein
LRDRGEGIPFSATLEDLWQPIKVARLTKKYQEYLVMKKQIKKLTLAKETLKKLDENDVQFVLGGISGSVCGNPTCKLDCGPTNWQVC